MMISRGISTRSAHFRKGTRPLVAAIAALGGAGALAFGFAPPAAAEQAYGVKIDNDMTQCAPGKGPAVRLRITGLRSGSGNLFVRTYFAKDSDWLRSRRYIHRIDMRPNRGVTYACVPLPRAGKYAIAVQHDANGNREKDFSTDGAGMSGDPVIRTFLGIPRPPALEDTTFSAGDGVTRLSIEMRYMD
ncbi:Uncharacterized conserved protein, DUF2141 family [Erythrobacter litoralis]|jgi:uncharacterized protein (DUF2141 family)|uniref:DUF2141 domain-containing protein n=1 Tax=Erythrobacter litoralis TaxID=39960 RepID=A0A074MND8_9SPHN|nr:DUF2141 domain-containing protein [Erythrobacter litoralis]AOL24978.1 Uncharacterized conserved protein, DUF2141 family [Erythrobacter litoralis]KEO96501.1 hypothetical protein EH32_09740 [Erythrobacter litoralis]MEE4337928.1 DUF2141 domain-containing protein [Erythrobacter sp.]